MKIRIIQILLLTVIVLFSSCELLVDAVTDDSTDTITYSIDQALNTISLKADMDMEIIESDDNKLIIDGPKALLDHFTIKYNSGHVILSYEKRGSWMYDKPQIKLRIPKICKINLYADNALHAVNPLHTEDIDIFSDGNGDINLKVNCKTLNVFGNNISDFYITGETNNLTVTTKYASSFYGTKLIADSITCNIEGSNHQFVNPTKRLQCNIGYSGNVYYVTEPYELQVNVIKNGSGQVFYDSSR